MTASLIAIAHVAGTFAAVVVAAFLAAAVVCAFGAIGGCVMSSRASEAKRRIRMTRPVTTEPDPIETYPPRPAPTNCQHEPPYPGHQTTLTSLRAPRLVAHRKSELCAIEYPHTIGECGEFKTFNPLRRADADVRMQS